MNEESIQQSEKDEKIEQAGGGAEQPVPEAAGSEPEQAPGAEEKKPAALAVLEALGVVAR